MVDLLRASLEECQELKTKEDIREAALDYIAKIAGKEKNKLQVRKGYAIELLEREFLPHISLTSEGNLKKAYFVGYMINRLLQAGLNRVTEDDRDHYGKKRMDMSGTLMASLFR